MANLVKYLFVIGLVFSLAGCSGFKPVDEDADKQAAAEAAKDAEKDARYGAEAGGLIAMTELDNPDSPLSVRVVYFEFDSSELSAESQDVISAHAQLLSGHPDVKIVLEGHTDERGTREYNLALGERRAKSVEQLMLLQGVSQDQIQVISFGEERPVALDHDESAWKLNRRVEILYSGI